MGNGSSNVLSAMREVHYKRTITNIERAIHDAGDLKAALEAALNNVVTAMKAEAGTLWFYDRYKDGRIRPYAIYGGGDLGGFSLAMGEGVAGKVIETGKATIVEDCALDPRWQGKADAKTGFVTKSMIVVPLKADGYTFASIQIINKVDGSFYDSTDLTFAKDLAEFSAGMFEKLGFIGNGVEWRMDNSSASFAYLVQQKEEDDMEDILFSIKEFALLKDGDQRKVLKYMKKIHKVFADNTK